MGNYLLLDMNSIGRAAHSTSPLVVGDMEVQAIYGTIRSIQTILSKYSDRVPIALWDGRKNWRNDLYPLYKANRNVTDKQIESRSSYRKQKEKTIEGLAYLGVTQMTDSLAEADDLAGYFSRLLNTGENKITLVTGDKDWKQLICANVDWLDHRTKEVVSAENFIASTGLLNTRQFLEAKCLMGDTSDNICGIMGGFGKDTAKKFLLRFGSVDDFLKKVSSGSTKDENLSRAYLNLANNITPSPSKKYGELLPMQDAFSRNMRLMELSNYTPNKKTFVVEKSSLDIEKFQEFCEDLMFRSITIQLGSWIKPFERLEVNK